MTLIYHLARAAEWEEAKTSGRPYARSTLGVSLEEQGFIHCSFARQIQEIADLIYYGRDDVVLLTIDVASIGTEIVVENLHGGDQEYPHIYGSLPIDAVVRAATVPLAADGRLDVSAVMDWSVPPARLRNHPEG